MHINFDLADKKSAGTHTNVGRETTTYRSSGSTKEVQQNSFALDISGTVMDNSAYAGHGRTAEEVMQEAGQQDIAARRNYMAVMSNSMSDEDFARLQEEGFHPGSTDIETVVTIVDHIKAALLKGGTRVAGYTDTLGEETLADITGSAAFANELKKQFGKYDIPLTRENIDAVTEAWETMQKVEELPEGSAKYMIENELKPTVENLYRARFSAAEDGSRQGKGYYAAGTVAGYYAKKPESIDYEQLMPQIKRVIEEAGFSVDQETVEDAKWLIEKGIPLNSDTFGQLQQIKSMELPEKAEKFVQSAAVAIADGKKPSETDITKSQSNLEQAVDLKERTDALGEEAADILKAEHLPFTLKNLFRAWETFQQAGRDASKAEAYAPADRSTAAKSDYGENISGRRLLEEIRMTMTVSANLKLLQSGFQIETAPIEELIEKLKQAESSVHKILTQETDTQAAEEKTKDYRNTLYLLERIRQAPIDIVNEVSVTDTLPEIEAAAKARSSYYEKAGGTYEALMTAPRKDMGDSIQKAFQNVDDILSEMNQEATEENRRAIRILGYNSMELTEENFEKVKSADALLTSIVDKMKPGTVLGMIREGLNPTTMPLEELKEYLEGQEDSSGGIESYSRFLYKLEQNNGISEEERSAYIGIYRLMRQIEKTDDAAVGAALQAGVSQSLDKLLTAVRSSKKKQMDYRVDDSFGGIHAKDTGIESITAQIEKGYIKSRKQLEEAVTDEHMQEAETEYNRYIYEEARSAMGTEEAVLKQLVNYHQPVTADHLQSLASLLKQPGEIFKKLQKLRKEDDPPAGEFDIESDLTDCEHAKEAYEKHTNVLQELVEKTAFSNTATAMDLKAMSTLYKQITFMGAMAREENYEMPVEINGNMTAINLKMIHTKDAESKVVISMETGELGKTAAEFHFSEGKLTGYGICSTPEGTSLLIQNQKAFQEALEKEGIQTGEIQFITGEKLNLKEFSLKESKDRISGEGTKELYRTAKTFIGYIQASIQKGNTEYENQL